MRRRPSRTMPPSPSLAALPNWVAWPALILVLSPLALMLASLLTRPETPGIMLLGIIAAGATVAITTLLIVSPGRRRLLGAIEADRRAGTICRFARSFDCRRTDTRIIRAVFEELIPYRWVWSERALKPVRRSDVLEQAFDLAGDDIEALVEVAAGRCGRSLDGLPLDYAERVATVGDLVELLRRCPTTRAA